MKTLVEVLEARKSDDFELINIFINAKKHSSHSYKDLYQEASTKAGKIATMIGTSNSPVLIEGNNDYEFISNFFAVQMSGNIPVPVTSNLWITKEYFTTIIDSIVSVTKATLFLCSSTTKKVITKSKIKVKPLTAPDWETVEKTDITQVKVSSEDMALIQFSSGSTGNPKGVKLTHKNVLANVDQITDQMQSGTETNTCVSWLPVHHDMGLIGGVIFPFVNRYKTGIMTPYDFAVNPSRWLKVITEMKASLICAPNSGYHMTTKKTKDKNLHKFDLSSVRHALCGAEPVNVKTLKAFVAKFSDCGFKESSLLPCYGMAENTLAISFHRGKNLISETIQKSNLYKNCLAHPIQEGHDQEDAITFISSGKALKGIEIKIIDENGGLLPNRSVGEIVIKSPSMTKGYYNREDLNEDLFIDGFLKTGDMGYMSGDNIFITGRKKDIIIVNGLNINAEEIEAHAVKLESVAPGKLVAVASYNEKTDSEEVSLLVEARAKYKNLSSSTREKLKEEIFQHMSSFIPLTKEQIHILAPGTIVKTTSGKVKRNLMKTLLEEDRLNENSFIVDFFQHRLTSRKIKSKIIMKGIVTETTSIIAQSI